MKKSGILNSKLMAEITALGHFDMFVICDMGFPIPKGSEVIDLALIRGVPGFMQTLKAILGEVVVQEIILMDAVIKANATMNGQVRAIFNKHQIKYKSLSDFREICKDARFFVRTAEDAPCSNMILVSASGVIERVEEYNVEL